MLEEKEVDLGSGKTVVISPLNALESIQADDILGENATETKANKVYAICSIRKLNNAEVFPFRNKLEFQKVAGQLSLSDLMALSMAVSTQLSDTLSDDLKKLLAASESDSSQER